MKREYGFLLGDELVFVGCVGEDKYQLLPSTSFKPGTPMWAWTTNSPTTFVHMRLKPEDFKGTIPSHPSTIFLGKQARPVVINTTTVGDSLFKEYRPAIMPKLLSDISNLLPNGGHIVDTSIVTGYCTRTIHLYHCPVGRIGTMYASPMSIGGRYFDIVDGEPVVYECIAYASKEGCLLLELNQEEVAVALEGHVTYTTELAERCASATRRSGSGMVDDDDDEDSTVDSNQAI